MKVLGVGIDLEPVDSFRRKKYASSQPFYKRLFSTREIAYCRRFRDPGPRFAGRFCAKEAIVKALSTAVAVNVFDFEIRNDRLGAPKVFLRSKKPALGRFLSRHEILISLTHTDDLAAAVAILVGKRKAS
jgi:holo-[acyl-carrier protein] synthase